MKRVYVDSNVFISLWDHQFGGPADFLEHYAEDFFNRALSCEFELVISDLVVKEICRFMRLGKGEIDYFLKPYLDAGKLEVVTIKEELWDAARMRLKEEKEGHLTDKAHLMAAEREGIPVVTWNVKDFPGAYTPKTI